MVLDALASYVDDLLKRVAEDETGGMLLGDIRNMGVKLLGLRNLKTFLADADRRSIGEMSVLARASELSRAMYQATDILDLCQLNAMERRESVDAGCCISPLLFFCIRNPLHARDIGRRIKKLNERLDAINRRSRVFSLITLGSYNVNRHWNEHVDRKTIEIFDRSSVVGEKIEQDTRELVAKILQTSNEVNNNDIMVVAIVGGAGIGKTTLAQKVFNHDSIQAEFDNTIWLYVTQNFDRADLLRTAIILAGGDHKSEKSSATLQQMLAAALEGRKFLLVMDDLWSDRAWDDLLKAPLESAAASGS